MAEGGQKQLVVGHDDKMTVMPNSIARADVASLCVEALSRTGLRFDVCSEVGTPTSLQQGARRSAVSVAKTQHCKPCVFVFLKNVPVHFPA